MKAAIVIGGVVLALAAGAVAFMLLHTRVIETKQGESPKPQIGAVLHLEPFVLNIAGSEQSAYLRVGIDLGLENTVTKTEGAPEPPTALVRDTILISLTSFTSDELTTPDGKQKLKEVVKKALQTRVPELHVREVYITEFLIQA